MTNFWRNVQGDMGVLDPELVGNGTREDILAQAEQLSSCRCSPAVAGGRLGRWGRVRPEFLSEQDSSRS